MVFEILPSVIVAYAAAVVVAAVLNWTEFSRDPEKRNRYRALPLMYKGLCWFGVLPVIATSIALMIHFDGWGRLVAIATLVVVAPAAYLVLEIACVRWYRRNGHL